MSNEPRDWRPVALVLGFLAFLTVALVLVPDSRAAILAGVMALGVLAAFVA